MHLKTNMGSHEWAIMGLESQAVSVGVTNKHIVTIFSKTCNI